MNRPTEAEFEELKRRRDAAVEALVIGICKHNDWPLGSARGRAHGCGACYCACPDGPCQHEWNGPWRDLENGGTATCSRCGADAMSHSLRCEL